MLTSRIVHLDGIFLGTAIAQDGLNPLRFYATHDSVRALHNASLPSMAALYTQVRRVFDTSRRQNALFPGAQLSASRLQNA